MTTTASFSALPNLSTMLTVLLGLPLASLAFTRSHAPRIDPARTDRAPASAMSASATTGDDGGPSSSAATSPPAPTTAASGVLFDIDGTLADSWRLGYDATVAVLEGNGHGHVALTEELYHATCIYPTPERLARTTGLLPGDDNFDSAGEELGRQFDEYYVKLVSPETCAFYDGILDILQHLPDETGLGALTNACAAYGHAVLRANCPASRAETAGEKDLFALYDRFGTIHGADSVPAAKPDPAGLRQCVAELGLDPRDCVYVGDAAGDGRAARAAGMMAVGVLWGSGAEEKLRDADTFDYLCATREDLRRLLPQRNRAEVT